jgi:HK97 family phage prohead protease
MTKMTTPSFKDAVASRETRSFALTLKASDVEGVVEGYGSVFDVADSYSDVIEAGAFKASLAAHKSSGTMPAMLWQHEADHPIGVWEDMSEDKTGLKVRGRLAMDTQKGREAHSLLRMGAITGLSIGFMSKQWNYDKESEVRTLTEIDLWEVSLVTFPANAKARVTGVKAADVAAITTIRQAERALRDAGFTDDAAKAFLAAVKRMASEEREAREAAARFELAASRLLKTLQC